MEKEKITRFRGDYIFLSNFYGFPFLFNGTLYVCAEAAFQAQKCARPEEKIIFAHLSGSDSKRYGRRIKMRSDWDSVKLSVMYKIISAKFSVEKLRQLLLSTGNAELIEGNNWGDRYWGVDLRTGVGENHLGRILMQVRDEIREGKSPQNL